MPGIFQVGAGTNLNIRRGSILFLQSSQGFKKVCHDPRHIIYSESRVQVVVKPFCVGFPVTDIDNSGTDPRIGDKRDVILRPGLEFGLACHDDAPRGHRSKDSIDTTR